MKYLQPTDDFCAIKSWSQAKKEFEKLGITGKVFLGYTSLRLSKDFPKLYIGPKPPEELRIIQWVCADKTLGLITMTAFAHEADYSYYDEINVLSVVNPGSLFTGDGELFSYEYECVMIDGKKLKDWTIFSVAYIDNEQMAKLISLAIGEKPVSATLHKCSIINDGYINTEFDKCETYVVPVWNIKCENGQQRIIAAFTEDNELLGEYSFNTMNWSPVNVGTGFFRKQQYYRLNDSEDKGYYFSPSPMAISLNTKNRILK